MTFLREDLLPLGTLKASCSYLEHFSIEQRESQSHSQSVINPYNTWAIPFIFQNFKTKNEITAIFSSIPRVGRNIF